MPNDKRNDLICKVIHAAELPPGKDSENYFTREQLEKLYATIIELKIQNKELSEQIITLTERVLDGGSAGPSQS